MYEGSREGVLVVGVVNMLRIIFGVALSVHVQGVPKKTGILRKMPITGLGRGLDIKVG